MESVTETDLIVTVILGTVVMFLLVSVIIWTVIRYQKNVLKQQEEMRIAELKYQSELLNASISAADRERERVSMNLHDEIGASVNVALQNLTHIEFNSNHPERIRELSQKNKSLLEEMSQNIRAIYSDLSSPTVRKVGFLKGFEAFCTQISESGIMHIGFHLHAQDQPKFSSENETHLYRVCKELMNNLVKHSGAGNLQIDVRFQQNNFSIEWRHDGKELNDAELKTILAASSGLGLKSILARVQILSGSILFKGRTILLTIPIT